MATTGRDYYEVLGVARDANEQEIKRSFRRLARELHPDVSQEIGTDERFPCPTCEGSGRVQQVSRSVFGEFVRAQGCPTCGGSGRVVETPCAECGGAGRVLEERKLEVTIPAGIHDGQQIRISGEGHAGDLGG